MQIINGNGTESYIKCINADCEILPANVLMGRHPQLLHSIQIVYCGIHEIDARTVAERDFTGIFFSPWYCPIWLRDEQAAELGTKTIERSSLRTKEP